MEKIKNFFNKIISSDSKESSKRFIALWAMSLLTYVILRYTETSNSSSIGGALMTFILSLLGVAVYEKIQTNINNKNKDHES